MTEDQLELINTACTILNMEAMSVKYFPKDSDLFSNAAMIVYKCTKKARIDSDKKPRPLCKASA